MFGFNSLYSVPFILDLVIGELSDVFEGLVIDSKFLLSLLKIK